MGKIGIYKVESPTGKIYIGQSINIEERWKKYKDWNNHKQPKISRSIKKHGLSNHIFEIIEECSLKLLPEREIYWKKYYINLLGWENVLFCHLVDGRGGKRSKLTRLKIGMGNKGKKRSDETKKKMREARVNIIVSKETGDKISKAKKGIRVNSIFTESRNSKLRKPIIQFDLEGNFIEEFQSYREARRITGIKMTEAVRGKTKTAKGYIWKKKEDLNNNNYDFINKKLKICQ
jgi:group I intron endonuclease